MDLTAKAFAHLDYIEEKFANAIEKSAENSIIYGGPNNPPLFTMTKPPRRHIYLCKTDSVSCLFDNPMQGKVAVLNFADYGLPGGLFLDGEDAQEEMLCHESTLYPILNSFRNTYYKWNKENWNKGLYLDRAIYTPDVFFFHGKKATIADVITCAAPNYNTASYQGVLPKENLEAFRQRVAFLNNIARENGVNTLIAGAWGCGVFGQLPEETCGLLVDELHIENLYLAIPPGRNYNAFDKVLKERAK